MTLPPRPATFPHRAAWAVQIVSVLIALVEVGRLAFAGDAGNLAVGAVAAALVLPLHVQHLRYGLQGLHPPRAGLTLGAMAAVHLAAFMVLGQEWALMLAMLATSALVVLRGPWAVAALVACCAAPLVISLWRADPALLGDPVYLAYAILFRSVIQFALVWLVAATHRLATARAALAAEAVEQERVRMELQVRAAVEQRVHLLVGTAASARKSLDGVDVAPPMVALDRVLTLAGDALADLRRVVSADRPFFPAVAMPPPGGGPTGVTARRFAVLVHAVVLPFPLLAALGLLVPGPASLAILVVWPLLAALEVRIGLDVSRGRRTLGPRTRILAAIAVGGALLIPLAGDRWTTLIWIPVAAGLLAFGGRGRAVAIAVAAVVAAAALINDPAPGIGLHTPVTAALWHVLYAVAIDTLAIGGLFASARLVARVDDLEETRAALARSAVDAEHRRLSSDLHDVLGQSLTALSLKADLARRLVHADRDRAVAELDGMLRLAAEQEAEVKAITRGARTVELGAEIAAAGALLEAAGARLVCEVDLEGLDDEARTLLAWVVREGATNVVRHARPRRCTLRVGRDADAGSVVLELTNDGVTSTHAGGSGGTGLDGLAGRLAGVGGSLHTERDAGGTFRLRVELPVLVPA
jgi:two-component system sensor histidine kinase DesK